MANDDVDIDGLDDVDLDDVERQMQKKVNPLADVESQLIEADNSGKTELFLHKEKCLSCSHLCIGFPNTVVETCTVENGNTNCPAQAIQISVGVDITHIASKIYSAKVKMEIDTYARRLKLIRKFPKSTQRKILDAVDKMSAL